MSVAHKIHRPIVHAAKNTKMQKRPQNIGLHIKANNAKQSKQEWNWHMFPEYMFKVIFCVLGV